MHPTACPICNVNEKTRFKGNFDYFDCDICEGVYIDSRLVRAPTQLDDYVSLLGAAREMQDKYGGSATIRFDGVVTCPDENSEIQTMTEFPRTIAEKAAVTVSAEALDAARTPEPPSELRRMQILFLAANPTTTRRLDLEEELRSLETELRGVKHRDNIVCRARHAVRPDDLIRYVREDKPNVLHFSGHGVSKGIILRNDTGGETAVAGSALERFLKGREIELVVLNSCFSKDQADLIKGAVKAVVGTTAAVGDEAARRFSVAFYRALGDGLSIKEAFRDGGDAVQLHGLTDVFHSDGDLNLKLFS